MAGLRRAVVPHHDQIVLQIEGVKFGKETAGAEQAHDFHRLHVLDFQFAGDGNALRREQGTAEDDRADRALVGRDSRPHVIIGQRTEPMPVDQPVEGDRRAGGPREFLRRAVGLDGEGFLEAGHPVRDFRGRDLAAQGPPTRPPP